MAAANAASTTRNAGLLDWGWEEPKVTASAVALLIFNLLDGLFTLVFLQLGVAEEANPLMRLAYACSPLVFMAVKLFVVSLGVLLLSACRPAPPAQWAMAGGAGLYATIVAYHLSFAFRVVSLS